MNADKPTLDEFVVTWATVITASSPIIAAKEAATKLRNDPSALVFYVERSEPRPALLNFMQIDLAADIPVVTPLEVPE